MTEEKLKRLEEIEKAWQWLVKSTSDDEGILFPLEDVTWLLTELREAWAQSDKHWNGWSADIKDFNGQIWKLREELAEKTEALRFYGMRQPANEMVWWNHNPITYHVCYLCGYQGYTPHQCTVLNTHQALAVTAWQCPVCKKVNAPFVLSCDCHLQNRK